VFEEFRRAQIAMKEKAIKDKEQAELNEKMKQMELNAKYKPPQEYMSAQQNDQAFFNYKYAQYQQQLANDPAAASYDNYQPTKSSMSVGADRDEADYSKQQSETNFNPPPERKMPETAAAAVT
jgi:hypothetical protein